MTMVNQSVNHSYERWYYKAFFAYVAVCAYAFLVMVPGIVGGLVAEQSISNQGGGFLAAANAGGIALVSLLGFFTLNRWNLRYALLLGCGLMTLGLVLSAFCRDETTLLGLQLLAGIGAGFLIVSALGVLGYMSSPDTMVALMMVGQFLLGAIGFQLLQPLLIAYGVDGLFIVLGVMPLPLLLFSRLLPGRRDSVESFVQSSLLELLTPMVLAIMVAVLLIFGSNQAVYTYAERIGSAATLSKETINDALSITNLAAIFAGFFIAWLGVRAGRATPVMTALIGMALAYYWLEVFTSSIEYMLANALVMMTLMAVSPYLTATLIDLDNTGRLASFANCMITVGAAMGPYGAGLVLDEGDRFWPLLAGSVAAVAVALLLMAYALRGAMQCCEGPA